MSKKTVYVAFFVLINLSFLLTAYEGQTQGVINLPQTGQTKCYDASGTEIPCSGTGQDGELQVGVDWPYLRFTVSGECVTDNLTGLMWAKNANLPNGTRTWQGALDYVASMNAGSGLCGYKDWRLPNVNELESLINAGEANSATWLNSLGFSNMQSYAYWSSTTVADDSNIACVVYMSNGDVDATYSSKSHDFGIYVWPVRSGQSNNSDPSYPANIWKTGQTTSYATGDDGDLERGVAWPPPRFTNHGDGTVTDHLTGLMWTKNANPAADSADLTWQEALHYVKTLNVGGYSDWRLPNRKELFSLINAGEANSAAWLNSLGFTNVQSEYFYWSSTTDAHYADRALIVLMSNYDVFSSNKSFGSCVWPVRSGQGPLGYPDISVTPNPVEFGSVNVGGTSDKQVTVKNDGNANLVIGTITSPTPPFSKATDNCSGQTIGPNATCTVMYRFAPTTSGNFSTNSNIPSNDPDENPITVTLIGAAATCTYSLSTYSKSFLSEGGTGTIGVITQSGCSWAAVSSANWIMITLGSSGTGSGTVSYSVSANRTANSRTGTMTIAGQTFTVTQSGGSVTCTYSLSPGSQSFGSSGGTGSVGVSTQSGCPWTAVSNDPSWIMITSGSSGTGSGTVSYSVSANSTANSRTGSMTIAGQTFTVDQSGVSGTSGWTVVTPPNVSDSWGLRSVHFTSANEGWVVGEDDSNHTGVLLHYSNGYWTSVNPPVVSSNWHLHGVHFTSSNEGWAVGEDDSNHTGVLLHYSNGYWTSVNPPTVSSDWYLYGVHFTSPNEGWAVGTDATNSRGILLHYSNGNWVPINPPAVSSEAWYLESVHFTSSNEGWAVGGYSSGLNYWKPVLLHYSNGNWVSINPPPRSVRIHSVYFISSSEGWAAGLETYYDIQKGGNKYRRALLHYSNNDWVVIAPELSDVYDYVGLNSVHFTSSNEGWAVGFEECSYYLCLYGFISHYSNGILVDDYSILSTYISVHWSLHGVHFTSPNEGWAVGYDFDNKRGVLLKYSSSTPQPRTLTIASSNPSSGVQITMSPNDNSGQGSDTTQFTRTYNNNTGVTLTAPSTAPGGNTFQKWQRNGVDYATITQTTVTMDANYTMTAVYVTPTVTWTLTVASSNPNSGVTITVSPNDNNGHGSDTTQFTRIYNNNTGVTLTAPSTAPGGNTFQKWQRNGVDYAFTAQTTVTMDANYTMTAVYVTPTVTRTLTVASSNPNSGVQITVSPNDNNGQGSDTTQFTRTYNNNTVVTLTAPSTAPGGNTFQKWQRNGVDYATTTQTTVTMGANYTMTAVYVTPTVTRTLTVASSNPSSGVQITVSPNDNSGQGNGTTQFTRTYNNNTVVTLTAPSTASGNNFQKWQRNGVDYATTTQTTVTMDANYTMTAVYVYVTPTIELFGLEVTQAIQDLKNSVPLIKDKPTFVRAHVRSTSGDIKGVTAKLVGTRIEGSKRERLGEHEPEENEIEVIDFPPDGLRLNLDTGFYFQLPGNWLNGTVELEFKGISHNIACKEPKGNNGNDIANDCKAVVTFKEVPPLKIRFYRYVWFDNNGNKHEPTYDDVNEVKTDIEALFPVPKVDADPNTYKLNLEKSSPPNIDDLLKGLFLRWLLDGSSSNGFIYAGILKNNETEILPDYKGVSYAKYPIAVGYFDRIAKENTRINRVILHEIGHTLGLDHTPNCNAAPTWRAEYEPCLYPFGYISQTQIGDDALFGFHIYNKWIFTPSTEELMTYCDKLWLSDWNYWNLMDGIKHRYSDQNLQRVSLLSNNEKAVLVTGSVSSNQNSGAIESIHIANIPSAIPPSGTYSLRFEDGNGNTLATYNFEPEWEYLNNQLNGIFGLSLPWNSNTARIVLLHNGQILDSRSASGHAPTVNIIYPNGGESLSGSTATIRWSASDLDGDPLSFVIQYSSDAGASWQTLTTDWTSTSYDLDLSTIPGTNQGLIRILASDGFHTAQDQSDAPFSVAKHPPQIIIQSPENNRFYAGDQTIIFEGRGSDNEDGILSDNALRWSSNLNGNLGSGHSLAIQASALAEGTHTITLTAQDSDGQTSSASITIQIYRTKPVIPATLSVAPLYFDFRTAQGSGQTVAKTLSIINSGNGTFTWSASVDQSWIQLSSYNGTAPSNIFVSANPAGLSIGQYTGNITVTANGAIDSPQTVQVRLAIAGNYTLTVSVSPSGAGIVAVNPAGNSYSVGTEVTLTATAGSGYTFSSWSGDVHGSTNPITIVMDRNKNITANFNQSCTYTLSININPTGAGTVTKNPNESTYCFGEQVTLTATPNSGYTFSSWSGVDSSSGTTAYVTINGNRTATAAFSLILEIITTPYSPIGPTIGTIGTAYSYSTGGSTSNLGHPIQYFFDWGDGKSSAWLPVGATSALHSWASQGSYLLKVQARCANDLSVISGWSKPLNVSISGYVPDISVYPMSYDFGNVKVKGSKTTSFTVKNNGTANLRISSEILGMDISMFKILRGGGSKTIKPGKTLTLKVVFKPTLAGPRQATLRITSNDPDTPAIDISLSGNLSQSCTYILSININPLGSGVVTKNPNKSNYCSADQVTLTASANSGYTFSNWTGDVTGSTNPITVTMDSAKSVTATFTLNTYTLNVSISGTGSGIVTSSPAGINCGSDCSESYNQGTSVTLSAAPALGSTFGGWSGDADCSDGVVVMDTNKACTATFDPQVVGYTLTVIMSGTGSGTVTSSPAGINCGGDCSETYNQGTDVTLTATAASGSSFTGWSGACSGAGTCTVAMTANKTVTANFVSSIGEAPTTPILVSPPDRSVFAHYPRTTVLKWSPSNGTQPITYLVQIQYTSCGDFSNFGSWSEGCYGSYGPHGELNSTEYTFDFVGAQPGRWRVRAKNSYGESDWSEWWYFRYTH